ncbi:chitinase [Kiritimatiellaeota bacterium B1221]|nr:chitinase [Kiritimatiellaeota bacterium B1221]
MKLLIKPLQDFKPLLWLLLLIPLNGCETPFMEDAFSHDGRRVVAYWHNWNSASVSYLPLEKVPAAVNTLIVAFALPENEISGRMVFAPEKITKEEFKLQVQQMQKRGVDVLISVGGGKHPLELNKSWMKTNFVSSLQNIIDEYGFDGVDINLEGASKVLDEGDVDFRNPTTEKILNMIAVVKMLDAHYGEDFLISVAPETQFVVNGYHRYGKEYGGYLPFLDALREEIDFVQMQYYNSGSQYVYTGETLAEGGVIVEQGTPDFVVGLAEMLIMGFPVGRDPDQYFEGLGEDKVVIGLPAMDIASSGGALEPEALRQAMVYLMTGQATYESALTLRKPEGYPGVKGLMTWSLNWDASTEGGREAYTFVNTARTLLRELVPLK